MSINFVLWLNIETFLHDKIKHEYIVSKVNGYFWKHTTLYLTHFWQLGKKF